MKALKRILVILILAITVLWIGLYVAVKIVLPPEKIKALVSKHGSELLGRELRIDKASAGVFPNLSVSIQGIKVANAPGFSKESCLEVKELALDLDLFSLLKLKPVIKEIRLVEPSILYQVNAAGENNLAGLGPKKDTTVIDTSKTEPLTKLPAPLQLKSFRIINAKVRYQDEKSGQEIVLGNINQSVSVEVKPNLEDVVTQGLLEINSISAYDKASGLRKGNINTTIGHEIEFNLPSETLNIASLQIGIQDIKISISGKVSQFISGIPIIDLHIVSGDIRTASLLKEVPSELSPEISKLKTDGTLTFEASAKGKLDSGSLPTIRASLSMKEISLSHSDIPSGIQSLNGELRVTENSAELQNLNFSMAGNPVSVKAIVSQLRPIPSLEQLQIHSLLDLGPLLALAGKITALPEGFSLKGLIKSDIEANGLLDPEHPEGLKAQGVVKLQGIELAMQSIPVPVKIDGNVNIDNSTIKQDLQIHMGESDLSVQVLLKDYLAMVLPKLAPGKVTNVNVSVLSQKMNLDELLPKSDKPDEPTNPLVALPLIPNFSADINVNIKKTQLMNLEMDDFKSKIEIRNAQVQIVQGMNLYTGKMEQNIHLDLRDTVNPVINLKSKITRVEANDFISRLNDKIPGNNKFYKTLSETDNTIYGKFNLDLDLKTNGLPDAAINNLTGTINAALFDGKIAQTSLVKGLGSSMSQLSKALTFDEMTFTKLDVILLVENGSLLVKDFQIPNSIVGQLSALGKIGFDNSLDLNLEQHLTAAQSRMVLGASSALSGAAAKATGIGAFASVSAIPKDAQGRAIVYYIVGGTLTKPKFALDGKRMAGDAGSQVKAAAMEALDREKQKLKAELDAKTRAFKNEAQAKIDAEKQKLEAEKKKLEAEKKKLEEKANAEKEKVQDKAKEEAKKNLKKLGF